MFASIRKLISEFGDGGAETDRFDDDDYRLAAAAIDGNISEDERERLRDTVKHRFDLGDDDADALIVEATAAEQEAIDLYGFTARLNRTLDEKGRARMIEMMWQIAYADGAVSEFEDNLIWRAADLLHVSRPERIALRNRVAEAQALLTPRGE